MKKRQRYLSPLETLIEVDNVPTIIEYLKICPHRIQHIEYGNESIVDNLRTYISKPNHFPKAIKAFESGTDRVQALINHKETSETQFLGESPAPKLVVCLENVVDPRNLGAIARSAGFFGVKHIIVPGRDQVRFTQASVLTARGAWAHVDLVKVNNMYKFLTLYREHTNAQIISTDVEHGETVETYDNRGERPCALILGSEEKGVTNRILKISDFRMTIRGSTHRIQSLNVSVAAGILLNHLSR